MMKIEINLVCIFFVVSHFQLTQPYSQLNFIEQSLGMLLIAGDTAVNTMDQLPALTEFTFYLIRYDKCIDACHEIR